MDKNSAGNERYIFSCSAVHDTAHSAPAEVMVWSHHIGAQCIQGAEARANQRRSSMDNLVGMLLQYGSHTMSKCRM